MSAMRMPWIPGKPDLHREPRPDQADFFEASPVSTGEPLIAPVELIDEDPSNPRTEFPADELRELAADIALHGVLQPIVVDRFGTEGRYRVRFGAKRLRASKLAGLRQVPIVVDIRAHDAYAQVAENQKRHGLSPLDLARFMRSRLDAGDSNAEIAKRMGVDQTTVAHYLALLTLPPVLEEALKSGRCTSPRTLYELSKLHEERPEQVSAIASGAIAITRKAVASLKNEASKPRAHRLQRSTPRPGRTLLSQANGLCSKLESLLGRLSEPDAATTEELARLRRRISELGNG